MVFSPRDEQAIRDVLSASGDSSSIRVASAATRSFPEPSAKMMPTTTPTGKVQTAAEARAAFVAEIAASNIEAHRRLAVSLNNAATLCHVTGDYERALKMYQECVQARMEALATSGGNNNGNGRKRTQPSSEAAAEAARMRCLVFQAEESALRRAAVQLEDVACLDMYLRSGTRHDELEAAFLPRADPVEIPYPPSTMTTSPSSSFGPGPSLSQVPSLSSSPSGSFSSGVSSSGSGPVPVAGHGNGNASVDDTRESSVTLYNMGLSHLRDRKSVV